MSWECFWVVPASRCRVYLRRYRSLSREDSCPALESDYSYCNARAFFCEAPASRREDGVWNPPAVPEPPHGDDRWPQRCEACARPFLEDDSWQVFPEHLYRRVETGQEWSQAELPPGAMWDGSWWPDKGDDGVSLFVKLPPGADSDVWNVDQTRNGGRVWERTGIPPMVTARPSILSPRYHGWLTEGTLSDSLGDRPLP